MKADLYVYPLKVTLVTVKVMVVFVVEVDGDVTVQVPEEDVLQLADPVVPTLQEPDTVAFAWAVPLPLRTLIVTLSVQLVPLTVPTASRSDTRMSFGAIVGVGIGVGVLVGVGVATTLDVFAELAVVAPLQA